MTAPQNKTQHELLQERAAAVDLRAYHLHLDLSEVLDSPTYRVTTRLELTSNEPELFLDYLGESVAEIKVNGAPQEVDFDGSIIRLHGVPVRGGADHRGQQPLPLFAHRPGPAPHARSSR